MSVSTKSTPDVKHISKLCNLSLSEQDEKRLEPMLAEAIDYIKILEELDTSDIEETYQVTGSSNVFQDEEDSSNTLSQSEALQNASKVVDHKFATKGIFERS